MAKVSRYATVRIASTINGQYQLKDNIRDGFFLDGRSPGQRETDKVDVTTDREDRGFLYAIYGTGQEEWQGDEPAPIALENLKEAVKQGNQSIDAEINDLADCAVAVTGRATLAKPGERQAYFAGILVKEAELVAVTTGKGVAYLYRNDAIYPLTESDFKLEPVDHSGNKVSHFEDYIAGVAGTIKYSNIAPVEQNDCLIVTNTDLMQILGQEEVLRILDEAYDQAEACNMIMEACAEKAPETSLQVMIGFVEYVIPAGKTGKLNLAAFNQQSAAKDDDRSHTTVYQPLTQELEHQVKAEDPDAAFKAPTEDLTLADLGDAQAEQPAEEQEDQVEALPFTPLRNEEAKAGEESYRAQEMDKDFQEAMFDTAPHEPVAEKFDQARKPVDVNEIYADKFHRSYQQADGRSYKRPKPAESGYLPADEYAEPAYRGEYDDHYGYDDDYYESGNTGRFSGDYDDEDYDPYDDDLRGGTNYKRIALLVIMVLICLACVFALYKMLRTDGGKTQVTTTEAKQTLPFISPKLPSVTKATTAATTKASTTAATTAEEKTANGDHQGPDQQAGNNHEEGNNREENSGGYTSINEQSTVPDGIYDLADCAMYFYGTANEELLAEIRRTNGMTSDDLWPGVPIYLP